MALNTTLLGVAIFSRTLFKMHASRLPHTRVCTCSWIYINVCTMYMQLDACSWMYLLYKHGTYFLHECIYVYVHSSDASVQLHKHNSLPIRPDQPQHSADSATVICFLIKFHCTQPPLSGWPSCWCPHHKGASYIYITYTMSYHVHTLHTHSHTVYIHLRAWYYVLHAYPQW